MREILFRGKCGYNNEWVEGFYYQAKLYRSDKELCHYITIPHPESDGQPSDHIMVNHETVGQFTGLTDKNGKKIFEGDIVRYMNKETMVISYRNESASFVSTYSSANFNYCASLMSANIYLEVIGSIHDNPELLENP